MFYNELQLICKDINLLQDSVLMGLLSIGFMLNGCTIYLSIQGYRVLPFGVHAMFVGLAVMNISATMTIIPFLVDTNQIGINLLANWRLQFSSKLQRKRANAMTPTKVNCSMGQYRIFSMTKTAKNKLYAALIEFPVNMLLGYSRDEFEMRFQVGKQN